MNDVVTVERRDSVSVVRIDDGKVNALTLDLIDSLDRVLTSEQHTSVAVVLTGRRGVLSAGLDRGAMLSGDHGSAKASLRTVSGLYTTLVNLRVPTVVACNGHALAAGALLLLVTDSRIGARVPSKIGLNEVQIGLQLFPMAVAAARARLRSDAFVRATLEGAVYDCDSAAEVGYLDRVVDEDDLLDVAVEHAARLGGLRRSAYLATRSLIYGPVLSEIEDALQRRRSQAPPPS
jgi:enoyl-CoA hydratase